MKGKVSKILVSLLIAMLMVVPVLAWDIPTETHNGNALWMETATWNFNTGTSSVGTLFNVTMYVNSTLPKIASWEFQMYYDSSWLNAINCIYSGTGAAKSQLFEKSGTVTMSVAPVFAAGSLLAAESWLSGVYAGPIHCPASLVYITFNITKAPNKGQTYTSVLDISTSVDTYLQDEVGGKTLNLGVNATATYQWTTPPKPKMGVKTPYTPFPTGRVFDRFTSWNGTTFDVPLYILSLDSAWYMTNASFTLNYDETLIKETIITIDSAFTGYFDNTTSGVMYFFVQPTGTPSGDVLVATVKYAIINQGVYPTTRTSPLDFTNTTLFDHSIVIPTLAPANGGVTVQGLLTLPLPYLAAKPSSTVFGPAPALGETFDISIDICNLHFAWYLVGLDFRLSYDPTLLKVNNVAEGPYFPQFNQSSILPYTVFIAFDEGTYVTAMDLVLPNSTGQYGSGPLPGADPAEDGTIAVITFEVIKQDVSCTPQNFTSGLNLYDIMMVDRTIGQVPYDPPHNATVKVYGSYEFGRYIDVFTQYPAPYGGQGVGMPSDMFWPQKEVCLTAYVAYNCWALQNKLVTFTVYDNQGHVWTQLTAPTNTTGYAVACFRMPWPCDNPESLFGVWTVTADVDIACIVVHDTVTFHYDYLINIVKVTTDKYYYNHLEYVNVHVEFTSHAQQTYNVSLTVTIHDNLNYPIASQTIEFQIGGATYCTAKEYERDFTLHILKFASAGEAIVYVTSRLLWNGEWVAAGPMATTAIYILPA